MRYAWQWILSLIFVIQMYLSLAVISISYFPYAIVSPKGAQAACRSFGRWVTFSAKWLVGITSEIRGQVPDTGVLIASKHQSFFDIILLFSTLRTPRFVMKSELRFVPFLGYYALRIGCVPINRGKRGAAIAKMLADALYAKSGRKLGVFAGFWICAGAMDLACGLAVFCGRNCLYSHALGWLP